MRRSRLATLALVLLAVLSCRPESVEYFRKGTSRDEFGCYGWTMRVGEDDRPQLGFYIPIVGYQVPSDSLRVELTMTSPGGVASTENFTISPDVFCSCGRHRFLGTFLIPGNHAWDEQGEWQLTAKLNPEPDGFEGIGLQVIYEQGI